LFAGRPKFAHFSVPVVTTAICVNGPLAPKNERSTLKPISLSELSCQVSSTRFALVARAVRFVGGSMRPIGVGVGVGNGRPVPPPPGMPAQGSGAVLAGVCASVPTVLPDSIALPTPPGPGSPAM
jgi:hypothetical protein